MLVAALGEDVVVNGRGRAELVVLESVEQRDISVSQIEDVDVGPDGLTVAVLDGHALLDRSTQERRDLHRVLIERSRAAAVDQWRQDDPDLRSLFELVGGLDNLAVESPVDVQVVECVHDLGLVVAEDGDVFELLALSSVVENTSAAGKVSQEHVGTHEV